MLGGWFGGAAAPVVPEPLVYPECETPTSAADYEALATRKYQNFLDLVNSEDGWTRLEFLEPGHTDIEIYDRVSPDSAINCTKTIAILPASPKTILELCKCTDVEALKQWDADVEQIKTIEKINENLQLVYSSYNAPYPVWKREFVAIRATQELSDGTCVSYGASVNHKDFPTPKEHVRGCIVVSGWHLKPVEGNPNATRCTRVVQLDPKGWIPSTVVNMFKNKSGLSMVAIRNHLNKQKQ